MLNLTVLSFGGQMVTYLLSAGYTSTQVGVARTTSVVFEVLATWAAPWLIRKIGVVRAGLWSSTAQFSLLVAGVTVFGSFEGSPVIAAGGLMAGTILSRVGLWGFDLCAQLIVQEVMSNGASTDKQPVQEADTVDRRSNHRIEAHSPRLKRPGRMHSSSFPTSQPLSSSGPSSLSGLASSPSLPRGQQWRRMPSSSTFAEAISCIWRSSRTAFVAAGINGDGMRIEAGDVERYIWHIERYLPNT
jgi:hypothetical protein